MAEYIASMRSYHTALILTGEQWCLEHVVKGKITIRVTSVSDEYLNGIIVNGHCPSAFINEQKGPGDFVRFTRRLIKNYKRI